MRTVWLAALPIGIVFLAGLMPAFAASSESTSAELLKLTNHPLGFISLVIFLLAYMLVIFEEVIHMRKSKPVLLAGGLIWMFIAIAYIGTGHDAALTARLRNRPGQSHMDIFSFHLGGSWGIYSC